MHVKFLQDKTPRLNALTSDQCHPASFPCPKQPHWSLPAASHPAFTGSVYSTASTPIHPANRIFISPDLHPGSVKVDTCLPRVCTPPHFAAAVCGQVITSVEKTLDTIIANPSTAAICADDVKTGCDLLQDAKVKEELLSNLVDTAKEYKKAIMRWFCKFRQLPLLVFELGGDAGPAFGQAFLRVFGERVGLSKTEQAMIDRLPTPPECVRFASILSPLANEDPKAFDTLELFQDVKRNGILRQEIFSFAHASAAQLKNGALNRLQTLYQWTCVHIFGIMTDQQSGESVFSFLDMKLHKNQGVLTTMAAVSLKMNEGNPKTATVEQCKRAQRKVKTWAKDYSSMKFILTKMQFLHPKNKEKKARKPSRRYKTQLLVICVSIFSSKQCLDLRS